MCNVIRLQGSTQTHTVMTDTDFYRLLRDTLGDEAADWYKARIEAVEEQVKILRPYREKARDKNHKWDWEPVYDYAKITKLSKTQMADILVAAFDIPGWDE